MKVFNGLFLIIVDFLGGMLCNVVLSNYLELENVEIIVGMFLLLVIEVMLNLIVMVKELI